MDVASKLSGKSFFIRLNSMIDPSDAVTNDVQYHLRCWIYAQQKAVPQTEYSSSDTNQSNVISDKEIINVVKCPLNYPSETV